MPYRTVLGRMWEKQGKPAARNAETFVRGESPALGRGESDITPSSPSTGDWASDAERQGIRVVRNVTDVRGESTRADLTSRPPDTDQSPKPTRHPDTHTRARGESVRERQHATRRRGENTS